MLRENLRDFLRSVLRSVGTRQRTLELLKTLTLVLPLTVLIWIYAERAQTSTEKASVFFDVTSSDPDQWATVTDPVNTPVTVELNGPRAKVDALKNELERISADRRLRVPLTAKFPSGSEPPVSVVGLFNNFVNVRNSGVTVTSATPATVKVKIDPLVPVNKPVRLPDDMPASLRNAIRNLVIEPATVEVRGPQTELDKIDSIPLDLTRFYAKIAQSPQGPQKLTDVPLSLPRGGPRLTSTPASIASVRFDVSANETEYVIPSLPIVVQMPLPMNGKVTVTPREKTVTNVKVRGPSDQVDKLRPQGTAAPQVVPTAVLAIRPEDVNALTTPQREVEVINLPPGVQVIGDKRLIEFTVKDIASPE